MPQLAHGSKETRSDTGNDRNQWHVYEFIKKHYMQHGSVPPTAMVIFEFHDLELDEINDGINEFQTTVKWVVMA